MNELKKCEKICGKLLYSKKMTKNDNLKYAYLIVMDERILNTDLVKLFKQHGWAYKIPDAVGETALSSEKRPFDGFAAFPNFDFFFESKLIKNKISAFAKRRVEDHQFDNLLKLKSLRKQTGIILGIWVPRKSYQFLVFDPEFIYDLNQKSILKAQLNEYIKQGFAFDMKDLVSFKPELLIKRRIDFLVGAKNCQTK